MAHVGDADKKTLQALDLHEAGEVTQCWGIALSSRLRERSVSHRMADAAKRSLSDAGYCADIELVYDESALQAGAGLAVFADTSSGARLCADHAGALRRSAEAIGKFVAHRLIEDLHTGATLDRYASDQIIPFTALAAGESRLRIPRVTEHIETSAWLCRKLLGAEVALDYPMLKVTGIGFRSQ